MRLARWAGYALASSGIASCLVTFEDYPEYEALPGAAGEDSDSSGGRGGTQSSDGGDDDPSQGGTANDGSGGGDGGDDGSGGTGKGGGGQGGAGTTGGKNSGGAGTQGGNQGKGGGSPTGGKGQGTGGAATTGGGAMTGGASTGGAMTGGASTGGAMTGGASTGGASTGGTNATGGSATGGAGGCVVGAGFRGSCAAGNLEYCVDGAWQPDYDCAGCDALSCGLDCCATMGAFVIEPPDFTQRPDLVYLFDKSYVPVYAYFFFDADGQIGGITFYLTSAQSISELYVTYQTSSTTATLDVALEDTNGVSGCVYPVDSIDGWVYLDSPNTCWGDAVFPVMQITPRVTIPGVIDQEMEIYGIDIYG